MRDRAIAEIVIIGRSRGDGNAIALEDKFIGGADIFVEAPFRITDEIESSLA